MFLCVSAVEPVKGKPGGGESPPPGPDPDSDAAESNAAGADHGKQRPVPRRAETIHVKSSADIYPLLLLNWTKLLCYYLSTNWHFSSRRCFSFTLDQRQVERTQETEGEAGGEDHGPVQVLRPFASTQVMNRSSCGIILTPNKCRNSDIKWPQSELQCSSRSSS